MKQLAENEAVKIVRDNIYYVLAAIASVPIWLAIDAFANAVGTNNDEAVAAAATGCLIICIFLGRHFGQLWALKHTTISNEVLTTLSVITFGSIVFLFVHAEYLHDDYGPLNLLLYWVPFLLSGLTLGMLIKLARSVTQNQLKEARAAAEHNKSELHLLQSQLSPHFLFNTLNNLYGLSLTQHERIPPLLLKLSDLLRYSVYEANEVFVPLKDELIYIHNYIEFEKIRIGDRLILTTNFEEITSPDLKIAPMLLIVFIENAFKHSKNTADEKIYISIELKTWENLILFSIKNSHDKREKEISVVEKHSGFGLASVNKRLELLYPNEHELTIKNEETVYQVVLRLKNK
ncbi:sensor histidine kinase [Dyadobacter psychrophilus]|uniref:GHKL domain-containing protein n=1 Tax=Dyadobacter psychrophilus TaxID=651661 RepID=A0A1T5GM64_9BACT|nr:histidine kinase [Dyadobacter psychrophilus]SKC09461.1 GHKL domain-containing protein [Dyadobacter psychrophilus]